jgi:hypothetical protein
LDHTSDNFLDHTPNKFLDQITSQRLVSESFIRTTVNVESINQSSLLRQQ